MMHSLDETARSCSIWAGELHKAQRTAVRTDNANGLWEAAMSFWSALFGGGGAKTTKVSDPVEYKGYVIVAAPYKNNGHYQTAGTIAREIGGVRKEHGFIRVDAYPSYYAPV